MNAFLLASAIAGSVGGIELPVTPLTLSGENNMESAGAGETGNVAAFGLAKLKERASVDSTPNLLLILARAIGFSTCGARFDVNAER